MSACSERDIASILAYKTLKNKKLRTKFLDECITKFIIISHISNAKEQSVMCPYIHIYKDFWNIIFQLMSKLDVKIMK